MTKKKIVHIITTLQRGGAEACLVNLITELHVDFEHVVIFFHDGPNRLVLESLGITCFQICASGNYLNPLFFLRLFKRIKYLRPDCLHTDLWAANLLGRVAAKMLKIPCVSVLHIISEHDGFLRRSIDALVYVQPSAYIAVSESVYRSIRMHNRYPGVSLRTIPNGIDHEKVLAASQIGLLQAGSGELFIFGAVGRLVDFKNYAQLIICFKQISEEFHHARLVIIGSGPLEGELRQLIQELNLHAVVTLIVGKQAQPYFPLFHCFVQPSWYEGLSIALLEALCFALPVIVTGVDQVHDVIKHQENGLVIVPRNQQELGFALKIMLTQPELRKKLGDCGYRSVTTTYAIKKTAYEYKQIFLTFM